VNIHDNNVFNKFIDYLLTKTETPQIRLEGMAAYVSYFHDLFDKATAAGLITEAQAPMAKTLKDQLAAFLSNPASVFVDWTVKFAEAAEEDLTKPQSVLNEAQRAMLPLVTIYFHRIVFSPPETVEITPKKAAEELRALATFSKEFNGETDRGAALVGAALVDNRLEELLRAHLADNPVSEDLLTGGATAVLGSFSARIKMCYALGLITKLEYEECEIVRKVRNAFAHRLHGLSFADQQVTDWCKNLRASPTSELVARKRYINSIMTMCMVLWYRPAHASSISVKAREWPWHLAKEHSEPTVLQAYGLVSATVDRALAPPTGGT
jgi:mannitol operon repressor